MFFAFLMKNPQKRTHSTLICLNNKAIVSWLFVHGYPTHSSLEVKFYRIWTDNFSKILENE